MPVSYTNGAIKVRDKDGNYVQFRGGSDDDWEKIRLALEELGYLKEDVQSLKEYILAGGGTGGGGGGVVDVDDASNTRKGITYLTDDPNANKNASTGVTAVTPKALQAAIDKLKEQIISGEITPPEPEPEPEPELTINTPTVTVTGAPSNVPLTPVITVSAFSGTDTFKATHWKVVKVSEARVEETVWEASSATTSVTVPQDKLALQTNYKFMARYEGVKGTFSAWAETTGSTQSFRIDTPTVMVTGAPSNVPLTPTITVSAFSGTDTFKTTHWKVVKVSEARVEETVWEASSATTSVTVPQGKLTLQTNYKFMARYEGVKGTFSAWGQTEAATPTYAIDTPTLTVTGAPDVVPANPTLTLSPFSSDSLQYGGTEWEILSSDASETLISFSDVDFLKESFTLARGHLKAGTSYIFRARYKAKPVAGVGTIVSPWAEVAAVTMPLFSIAPGDFGLPGESGFGVGVAPEEVYQSLNLKPLPGTEDPESFQYGLYEATASDDESGTTIQTYHAYLKYIPQFYYRFLGTDYLPTLKTISLFTGLSVEQLQQAQDRAGAAAIALAPPYVFKSELHALQNGFLVCRGFYDDGKVKPGFFISNTIAMCFESSDAAGNTEIQHYCGAPSFQFSPVYRYSLNQQQHINFGLHKQTGLSASPQFAVELGRKFTGFNCMSIGMWQAITILCYAAGLYCKDNSECEWYAEGYNACPCGINTDNNHDDRDSSVTTSPTIDAARSTGVVWVSSEERYPKTTHNGRVNGITNCNGWCSQITLGYSNRMFASLDAKLADITKGGDECKIPGGYELDYTRDVANTSYTDGGLTWNAPQGTCLFFKGNQYQLRWAMHFVFPANISSVNEDFPDKNLFGGDTYPNTAGYTEDDCICVGGGCRLFGFNASKAGESAGIMSRSLNIHWDTAFDSLEYAACRIGGYPEV